MMDQRESRPGNETEAAEDQSGGRSTSIIPDRPDNAEWPTAEEIMDLVMRHPRARAVNWEGYQRGFLDGVAYAEQRLESVAEVAARRFISLTTYEIDVRRDMQLTREWFSVERARAEQRAAVQHG